MCYSGNITLNESDLFAGLPVDFNVDLGFNEAPLNPIRYDYGFVHAHIDNTQYLYGQLRAYESGFFANQTGLVYIDQK